MLIRSIKSHAVKLPFRFSFGHALASRNFSLNVLVKVQVVLEDGREVIGWGESVPRQYVTGETVASALAAIDYSYAPALSGQFFADAQALLAGLAQVFAANKLEERSGGASFCALELAFLDALAKAQALKFCQLPALISPSDLWQPTDVMQYGGVIPFGKKAILKLILAGYKKYGFKTVKLKVGGSLNEDVARVKLAREILGEEAILRVDANCAWTLEQAKWSLAALRPYRIASCEQPLVATDLPGLSELTATVPEVIMVDESLTTLAQAKDLIERKACNAFNIRLSKVGGLVSAMKMVELANENQIECHLGAQVGESGILVAAQRHFALAYNGFANVEGAMNLFLLKGDLVKEAMTVPYGAKAKAPVADGLGVSVNEQAVARHLYDYKKHYNLNVSANEKSESNATR
ncbi:MAG: enolase C-terminal domain-like protein [Candidatus Obscuribacterales bacterium]